MSRHTAKKSNTDVAVLHRVMAHHIVYGGKRYTMHVATIYTDGSCTLEPFSRETPNTRFVNGTITLDNIDLIEYVRNQR